MEEPRWIRLDQGLYCQPHQIGMTDVEVEIFISPYEIPRAVRGYRDERRGRFNIEFAYITRERTKKTKIGPPGVRTIVGRKTGRIRGFEIDVDQLGATSVELRLSAVQEAIAALRREREVPRDADPWEWQHISSLAADRILQDRREEVFAEATR